MKAKNFTLLYNAMFKAIERNVDGRIRRNVVRDSSFKGDLANVLYTYLKLRQHVDETSVSFGCGSFSISSYPVPKFLTDWIESGKMFFDDASKGKATPIYSEDGKVEGFVRTDFVKDWSESEQLWTGFTILSPSDVEAFWGRLNLKVEFVNQTYKRSALTQVCRVYCGDTLYEISSSLAKDEELSVLISVVLPDSLGTYLRKAVEPTEEEIVEWIFKKLKSEEKKTT